MLAAVVFCNKDYGKQSSWSSLDRITLEKEGILQDKEALIEQSVGTLIEQSAQIFAKIVFFFSLRPYPAPCMACFFTC